MNFPPVTLQILILAFFGVIFKTHNVSEHGMQARRVFLINPGGRAFLWPALTLRVRDGAGLPELT